MSVFPLASLSQGAEIFIDANILVYAMTGVSMDAAGFLTRCENGDVSGFTSADVLRDVCHKLMIAEANAVYGTGIGKRPFTFRDLKANPHLIRTLSDFRRRFEALLLIPLGVDALGVSDIAAVPDLAINGALATGDACVLHFMNKLGLANWRQATTIL